MDDIQISSESAQEVVITETAVDTTSELTVTYTYDDSQVLWDVDYIVKFKYDGIVYIGMAMICPLDHPLAGEFNKIGQVSNVIDYYNVPEQEFEFSIWEDGLKIEIGDDIFWGNGPENGFSGENIILMRPESVDCYYVLNNIRPYTI